MDVELPLSPRRDSRAIRPLILVYRMVVPVLVVKVCVAVPSASFKPPSQGSHGSSWVGLAHRDTQGKSASSEPRSHFLIEPRLQQSNAALASDNSDSLRLETQKASHSRVWSAMSLGLQA